MSDTSYIHTVLAFIACFFVGVLVAWVLYRRTDYLNTGIRYALFGLRTISVTCILYLLFAPLVRSVTYQLEKPVLVIGQDNSMSAGSFLPEGFDLSAYHRNLEKLAKELAKDYDVRIYHFSDSVKRGFNTDYDGKMTNGSAFISRINEELLNRNVGAVILATDGIFNRGGNPLYALENLKAPLYTIALGDTVPKKDVLISNINYNSLVHLDNEFSLEIQAQAFQARGETTLLSVLENGSKVYEERMAVSSDPYLKQIVVNLKAKKIGFHKYTVQLAPVSGEISRDNNRQDVFVEVIDTRQKVLLAAQGPHPDIAALKQVISSNKHYDLQVVMGEDLKEVNPKDFGLIIMYQLPAAGFNSQAFFAKLNDNEVPKWYIIGVQNDLPALNKLQNGVSISGNSNTIQEAFSYVDETFTAFSVDKDLAKLLNEADPLQSPFGKVGVNAVSSVLLKQRIGNVRTAQPQLFFLNDKSIKHAYLIGEGIWRWKLAEAKKQQPSTLLSRIILGTVQYLSSKDDRRKFRVNPSKRTYDEQERVIFNAVLYNDNYEPVNTVDANLQIKGPGGKIYQYLFSPSGSAYQLDAGSFVAGTYSYTAKVRLGNQEHTATGVFYINAQIAEYQQTVADHRLLNRMAATTNGKMYFPGDLNEIAKDIRRNELIKTISFEDRKYQEIVNFKWLFILVLILLSAEWFLRKRQGEI